jgi:hypothetical protein
MFRISDGYQVLIVLGPDEDCGVFISVSGSVLDLSWCFMF